MEDGLEDRITGMEVEESASSPVARSSIGHGVSYVRVYGGNHSPWVQAVLLGLHDAGIPHRLETVAPLELFLHSGVLMPAASIDNGDWILLSDKILGELGYGPVTKKERKALLIAWQGVQHRADSIWRFWHAWSLCRDEQPGWFQRMKNHLLRPFTALYFLLVLKLAGERLANPNVEEPWRQFAEWEERLDNSPGPFLAGDAPDSVDFSLFGVIQCHSSIRVPPVDILLDSKELPRLRAWIREMQDRFADYRHLYSGQYFQPVTPAPRYSTPFERLVFWLGSTAILISFPVTVPLAIYYMRRIRRLRLAE